jgi:Lar family restriction alleviation protein
MTTLKLRECPFCGEDDAEMEREGTRSQSCVVRCGYCGASIEGSETGQWSGRTWNQRAYDADVASYAAKVETLKAALAASEAARERAERVIAKLTAHIWDMQDQGAKVPADPPLTEEDRETIRRANSLDAATLDAPATGEPSRPDPDEVVSDLGLPEGGGATLADDIAALREAGGDGWDRCPDPAAELGYDEGEAPDEERRS